MEASASPIDFVEKCRLVLFGPTLDCIHSIISQCLGYPEVFLSFSIPFARRQSQVAFGSTSLTAADMDSLEPAAIIGIELEVVSFCGRKTISSQ